MPFSKHHVALNLGKADSIEDRKDINNFVSSLSPVRLQTLHAIVNVIRELLKPSNAAVNQMSEKAFAIVCAPCLLRAPTKNPQVLIKNMENEVAFVFKLLKFLDTTAYSSPHQNPGLEEKLSTSHVDHSERTPSNRRNIFFTSSVMSLENGKRSETPVLLFTPSSSPHKASKVNSSSLMQAVASEVIAVVAQRNQSR